MSDNWKSSTFRKLAPGFFATLIVVAVACAAESSDTPGSSANSSLSQDSPSAAVAVDSGLDEACIQRVLGRTATGFGDITAAERDAVFEQCSGSEQEQLTRQFATGGAGNLLANLDETCVTEITGNSELDLAQLSLEQRQELFTECAPEDFQGRPGGDRFGGGFTGIGELLDGCVTDALGETPESLFALTPQQTEAIAEACGDEFPDGFEGFQRGGGGDGFFGGGQEGFGGRQGGAGRFGGIDFSSECVTSAIGRSVTEPGDLTQAEFGQIFATCFQAPQ